MKPQSLQDAIKANALKKAQARQNGGWKEPVVKVHKVTAADMKASAPSSSAAARASAAPAATNNYELTAINGKLSEILHEIRKQGTDIQALKAENERLRDEVRAMKQSNHAMSNNGAAPMSPMSPKKPKVPASLQPHSEEDLVEAQRVDPSLRTYMKTKQGLFDAKYMSLRSAGKGNIVCFKKRIYIPTKLRRKTIDYYKNRHNNDNTVALDTLRKNCIWPELEKDFYGV